MSGREQIKSLLKEAELYRSQGLLEQSKTKYLELKRFIENHEKYSKDKKLLEALHKKIRTVDDDLAEVEAATDAPELTPEVQALIGKLFSYAKNKEMAAIEGAVALAKFGQYDKALEEFQRLIKEGTMPLLAAKNTLKCHLTLSSPDAAIDQFKRWVSRQAFLKGDLNYLRSFLQSILERQGVKVDLPKVTEGPAEKSEAQEMEEDLIEISSVGLPISDGPRKGEMVELDVTFQAGNKISVVIPANQKDIIGAFKQGLQLDGMQCYSPLAVFNARGAVSGMKMIPSGPKRGDYALDITILSM